MRKLLFILCTLLILSITLLAQDKGAETSKSPESKKDNKPKEIILPYEKEVFVDLNGNGINDKVEQKGKPNGRKSDKFVDKDGDGINDNRCQGLGWGNKGKQFQKGKRGK